LHSSDRGVAEPDPDASYVAEAMGERDADVLIEAIVRPATAGPNAAGFRAVALPRCYS
jgi:hypothetical protein